MLLTCSTFETFAFERAISTLYRSSRQHRLDLFCYAQSGVSTFLQPGADDSNKEDVCETQSSVNGFLLKTSTSEVRRYPKSMGFLAVVSPFLGSKPFALLLWG